MMDRPEMVTTHSEQVLDSIVDCEKIESKPMVQPDGVADDLRWNAVTTTS